MHNTRSRIWAQLITTRLWPGHPKSARTNDLGCGFIWLFVLLGVVITTLVFFGFALVGGLQKARSDPRSNGGARSGNEQTTRSLKPPPSPSGNIR